MFEHYVGIDISKANFDASVEVNGKVKHRQFSNAEKGFEAFLEWCAKLDVRNAHFCMEATGAFWIKLATFLSEHSLTVSVVNPACIKRFAQSELKRTKTDKVDAGIIGRFCKAMNPAVWEPVPPENQTLQQLVRRVYDLMKMRQQERNRRASQSFDGVALESVNRILKVIDLEIARLKRQIESLFRRHPALQKQRELLLSIPGIGPETAHVVMSEVPRVGMFESAKQLVAYAGLAPKEITSGHSIRGRTRLSKTGRSRLRSALYLPSVVSRQCNPIVKAFCARLLANKKAPMKVVSAAMRKLLHIVYGVLKSGKPFCADLVAT